MDKLMEHLDSNLITLRDHLKEETFQRILMIIWGEVVNILSELVSSNVEVILGIKADYRKTIRDFFLREIPFLVDDLQRKRPPTFYSNLRKTLQTLVQFFNLGEEELEQTQALGDIERVLGLYGLETSELIHQYYKDRLRQQNELETEPYGLLTVRAYFFNDLLNIQILNARNLKTGESTCDFQDNSIAVFRTN